MQAKLTVRPVEHVLAAIEALDLEPIRMRVMDAEFGEGWTREHADSVERGYRNYLRMLVKHPEDLEEIVVSKEVDEFWHMHILHTMKYTEDCEKVFGTYLHHNPQSRERTVEDAGKRSASIERTRRLYQGEFGAGERQSRIPAGVLKTDGAAYCGALQVKDQAAYCGASLEAKRAAYCGAALRTEEAAYCGALQVKDQAAYCGASLEAKRAAYCGAAVGVE